MSTPLAHHELVQIVSGVVDRLLADKDTLLQDEGPGYKGPETIIPGSPQVRVFLSTSPSGWGVAQNLTIFGGTISLILALRIKYGQLYQELSQDDGQIVFRIG